MYVIAGASGNTGKKVAELLLDQGKNVKAISRNKEHLEGLTAKGAEAAVGDLTDRDFLAQTLKDAAAAYFLVPPNFTAPDFRAYQNEVIDTFASAVEGSGLTHLVTLSSFGAHLPKGNGVIGGLYDMEQKLNALPNLHVLHLRAGFFYQNFAGMIPVIKQAGVMGGFPISGQMKIPMVHTDDIARVAANHLLQLDFSGKDYTYVAGPEDSNLDHAASILGQSIDMDLKYVQFPDQDAKQGMLQMGASESLANNYLEFSHSVNEGKLGEDYAATGKLERGQIDLPTYGEVFRDAYHNM